MVMAEIVEEMEESLELIVEAIPGTNNHFLTHLLTNGESQRRNSLQFSFNTTECN